MVKTILFDTFIDVEFTIEQQTTNGIAFVQNIMDSIVPPLTPKPPTSKVISFRTPRTGPKPNIALSVDLLPGRQAAAVTLKITNFFSAINISDYKYMRIKAGYNNGPSTVFDCEIFEVYVERPNPEGITVFMANIGIVSDLLNKEGEVTFTLDNDTVNSAIKKIASAMGLEPRIALPPTWLSQKLPIIGHTYTFTNALTAKTWFINVLNDIADNLDVEKVYCGISSGLFKVYTMGSKTAETPIIVLDKVSVAYLAGGYINIKGPWNPMLPVNETNTCFRMDTRFFRGRRGAMHVGGEKKEFAIYSMHVSFSTQGDNEMSLQAIDTSTGAPA